jgi:hypothetical protein
VLRGAIFLKISTIGNNRWPWAVVRLNTAYIDTVEPPCSGLGVDDVYRQFGRPPGAVERDFSRRWNGRQRCLPL